MLMLIHYTEWMWWWKTALSDSVCDASCAHLRILYRRFGIKKICLGDVVSKILPLPRRLSFHPCRLFVCQQEYQKMTTGFNATWWKDGIWAQEGLNSILVWILTKGWIQDFFFIYFNIVRLCFFGIFTNFPGNNIQTHARTHAHTRTQCCVVLPDK